MGPNTPLLPPLAHRRPRVRDALDRGDTRVSRAQAVDGVARERVGRVERARDVAGAQVQKRESPPQSTGDGVDLERRAVAPDERVLRCGTVRDELNGTLLHW